MPSLHPAWAAALLTATALLLAEPGARRRALLGTVPLVLGLLALQRALAVRGSVNADFLRVNGALLAAGLGLMAVATARGWRKGERGRLAPLVVGALVVGLPAFIAGQVPPVALLFGLGVAALLHRAASLVTEAPPVTAELPQVRPWWVGPALAAAAILAPHAAAMAVLLVLLLAWYRHRVRAALAAVLLVPALVLASAIAGPIGLWMSTLGEVPFSPYAAVIVGGVLILAAFVVAGVVPFARDAASALLAPMAAAFLLRVVLPALPDAVGHWRSPAAAWLVVAAVIAAVRGRPDAYLAASGLFVLLVGEGAVAAGSGAVLSVLASGAVLASARPPMPRVAAGGVVAGAAALAAGLGVALEQEVVYTVLMAVAAMAMLVRCPQWLANTVVRARASNETTS